ncbi:TIGR03435 family protein [Granulicella tundricola]|uniref:Peptidase M56, BlaR1 n=1 Tax=Granulicella tundricola (strain ATCC BAA-1859 / DSM 23138 / MP5ACTX9) TaxID=1198114 RepID=E8X435_GRATM|nr:TIGR03435 family protein [Granulicella tundricola]ADW67095.1 peptidase M56, BlaR1 [Granulicella tundricola MP5ACTX9]
MVKLEAWRWVAVTCFGLTAYGFSQEKATPLTFEVATVRLTKPGELDGWIKALPGGAEYTAHNIPVKLMISLMYKVPMRQISGGPDWMETDKYDVEAKADKSYSLDDLHTMYRGLLAERFHLKVRKEIHEGPVYALTVDKGGVKMKPDLSEQSYAIPITYSGEGAVGNRVPMSYLSWWLGQQLQSESRPVVDETGLKENFDFTLSFTPPRLEGTDGGAAEKPSLFTAVKEQLGLKLEAQKGPVEYYVIEHIERPSAN